MEQVVSTMTTTNNNHHDSRWMCSQCGDLDYLNDDGLCAQCVPEQVVEWWQVMVRVVTGESSVQQSRWRIG